MQDGRNAPTQSRRYRIVRQGIKTGLQVSAKRASRIVPLTENLAAGLDEYLQMRRKVLRRKIKPEDYVFVSLSNNSNLKHTDGRTLSAHSLRHTAGTLALRTGSDLRQVQDLLGHADPRTTSIYAHVGIAGNIILVLVLKKSSIYRHN